MDGERLVIKHSDKLTNEAGDRQPRGGTDPLWLQAVDLKRKNPVQG